MNAFPRVWDLIEGFKAQCQAKGWKTSDREDWIWVDGKYHNFLWIRSIYPSTFEKVAVKGKCAIREEASYRVVDVSYTAWVCLNSPPRELMQLITENPELLKKNAIYDLSEVYSGTPICLKLNETDSEVFKEFEKFLEKEWKVKFKTHQQLLRLEAR